jgi:hypothetical protein
VIKGLVFITAVVLSLAATLSNSVPVVPHAHSKTDLLKAKIQRLDSVRCIVHNKNQIQK